MRLLLAAYLVLALVHSDLDWPSYGFHYDNMRHVDSRGMSGANVARLSLVWRFILGPHERVETTPIVVGNVMYVTTGLGNNVIALDATTGKVKWRFVPTLGPTSGCCGSINRGVAVSGKRVFFATLDGQLIALDAARGKPLWRVRVGDAAQGFSETMAPLVWNGIVYIGSAGADFGIRGSFSAYRASDGKELWRWYSVSPHWEGRYAPTANGLSLHRDDAREKRDAQKYRGAWSHGGGAMWMTPALDATSGTLYVSTANPAPVFNGAVRPGDNLYTDSVVALDALRGTLRWYFQETPHDMWEYEAASPPVLFEARDGSGKRVAAVAEAGKTAWLYILDRHDGKLLRISERLAPNEGLYADPAGGPISSKALRGIVGPISYNPSRHLAFVSAADRTAAHFIAAVNVDTGKIMWKKMLTGPHTGIFGGVMPGSVSAGDLVFAASWDGTLYALNAESGAVLWQYALVTGNTLDEGASVMQRFTHRVHDLLLPLKRRLLHQDPPSTATAIVNASPIVYAVDGREYVEIGLDAQPESAAGGAEILVFALAGR